jgi:small subunit ribosomal protein S2
MAATVTFTMRQLLEAGVHFGHQTHRWNPKMASYIYGSRNGIHILDLSQTVPLLHNALQLVTDTVAKGGRVLFVGTKRSAAEEIAASAKRCAQYYVNARWLGGMLTNWKTISARSASFWIWPVISPSWIKLWAASRIWAVCLICCS